MLPLATLNEFLETHKNHKIGFTRARFPMPKPTDDEGFPLPETAGIKDPSIVTALSCFDCRTGVKVGVDPDLDPKPDITK